MNIEHQKNLIARFSTLFSNTQYGICCDDGWLNLLTDAAEKLVQLEPKLQAIRVKNKLGGLRIVLDFGDQKIFNRSHHNFQLIRDLIKTVEAKSFSICEVCGDPGKCVSMQTRCEAHREKG